MLVHSVLQHSYESAVEFTSHSFLSWNAAVAPNAATAVQMHPLDAERPFGNASFNRRKNVY